MKKEYVVLQIAVAQDGSPAVTLSMLEEEVLKSNDKHRPPHHPKDIQYMLNTGAASSVSMNFNEYSSSGIKVGDKVSVEVTKLKDTDVKQFGSIMESAR
jgi:hypothetical protein